MLSYITTKYCFFHNPKHHKKTPKIRTTLKKKKKEFETT